MDEDPWRRWQAYGAQFLDSASSRGWPGQEGAAGGMPFAAAFERFSNAARGYFDALAKASSQPSADAAREFSDALRELFVDLAMPWAGASFAGDRHRSRPVSLWDAPALGPNRERQLRWQRMAAAWCRIGEAQRRLQRLWADALRDAVAAFVARPALSEVPTGPDALYELYGKWVDWVEDAYSHMAHSEPFCNALADAVNAGSEWRREVKVDLEDSAKQFDLPTRSEVNSLTRRLNRVEAELRAMHTEGSRKAPMNPAKQAGSAEPIAAANPMAAVKPVAAPRASNTARIARAAKTARASRTPETGEPAETSSSAKSARSAKPVIPVTKRRHRRSEAKP